tara:strand:+ start:7 stop:741 length:735 start_codon:yes stop_codon:yes gene_type:complete
MSTQNTTHAVMSQRHEDKDSLDYFPTPPWATRALFQEVLKHPDFNIFPRIEKFDGSCLEPACGGGHMVKVLQEYFLNVQSCDIADYGQDRIQDFLALESKDTYDFIVTNPPFNLAEEFVRKALPITRQCVAIFARTQFMESIGRYERLFKPNPPHVIAQFSERVPIVKGRLSATASTATSYAWFIWRGTAGSPHTAQTKLFWIPPSRRTYEKPNDYEERVETPHSRPTGHASQANLFGESKGDI